MKTRCLLEEMQDVLCRCQAFYHHRAAPFLWSRIFRIKALLYGVELGDQVLVSGTVDIMRAPRSRISLGDRMTIVSSSQRCSSGAIYAPAKLRTLSAAADISVGDDVSLNGTSIVARSKRIEIGDGTMIAPNVTIVDSDFHALWPPEGRAGNPAFEKDKDVIIGKNVWIGTRCIILRGAVIGDNSVISAGSVVQKRIPKNVVAGGRPAEVMFALENSD